ncbi:MAG: 23S rRNA (adenine(2503)-C(2))-methyltransferase RlmN [Deltaproteobacteria bacterium]|nr:23S rRNA (adenine(2503)-C(2))-methyltransferase RlmN [Deltaproteobacteria bacterium]
MHDNLKTDIKDLTKQELALWLNDHDIRSFHAEQIFKWIYIRQADSFHVMTDLGKIARDLLSLNFSINRLDIKGIENSEDGSRKYLIQLNDGRYIESVLIPEKDHYTLCISTQVGCAQGCLFCMTARAGFIRNLSSGEITAQIRDIKKNMADSSLLKNIVFMGMGEPLANFNNVIRAIEVITDGDSGFKFSTRRVTVSTAGLVPKLFDLGRNTSVNLAISLNATDDKKRSMLMPVNRKYPIKKLIEACELYPLPNRRKITFEYILIKGINDSEDDAERLAKLLRPVKAKINLIPFNEHKESDFKRPSDALVRNFQKILSDNGYTTIVRQSKGRDISAACGQLGAGLNRPGD